MTPEASSGLTNVEKRASAAGYAVYEILGLTGKMVTDSKGAFRTSYVGQGTDMVVGLPPGTLTCTWARLLSRGVNSGGHKNVSRDEVAFVCHKRWLWHTNAKVLK